MKLNKSVLVAAAIAGLVAGGSVAQADHHKKNGDPKKDHGCSNCGKECKKDKTKCKHHDEKAEGAAEHAGPEHAEGAADTHKK